MSFKKFKSGKLAVGVVSAALAISLVGGTSAQAAGLNQTQIDAIVSLLSSFGADGATISNVTAALNGQATSGTGSSVSTGSSYTFTRDLTVGATGEDVKMLQVVLNKSADTRVAETGAGSPGNESTYFGSKTTAALAKWQAKMGITPAAGYFGPKTRAAMNASGTTGSTGSTGSTTGSGSTSSGKGLTVASTAQPTASLAPTSAARVPFTKVVLTASADGDVVVNGVTVERAGFAQDAVFSGVVLLDENGIQLGVSKTLNSNHQVTVGDPFTIKAGTSKTVTVAGNMASDLSSYAGQVAALSVVGVNTSATVNGSLPITGAAHTINATLSLGSATLTVSSFDPNGAQTKEIGTTGYKFSGIRITAGSSEKVRLHSIRWNQKGSASSNDLSNVKVVVDGTKYDTTVSTDGKYYSATFGSGIVIDKGFSKDVYIEGDLIGSGSASRTVQFDIYKNTDIYLTGETYGYGVTATPSGSTASSATTASQFLTSDGTTSGTPSTPFFDASLVTVSAGSVTTIAKANSVAAQNIAVNVPSQVLGGYEVDIKGEPISVQQSVFRFGWSSGAASSNLITNVSVYDENGAVVAGPLDGVAVAGTQQKVTFTDTITYPLGKHTYTIKGTIPNTVSNGVTVTASTTPSSDWSVVQGQTTGNSITLSQSTFSMNTMTVKAGSLAISVSPTPAARTIVAGSNGTTFAVYQLDASQSGEDVRFSSIPLKITFAGSGALASALSNCQLFDGSTALNTGSNVVNPSSSVSTGDSVTYTLDSQVTIPKGTVKSLTLKCNVSSLAVTSATYQWGVAAAPAVTVTGVTSSNDVTETVTASNGQAMTIASAGSFAVNSDTSLLYAVAQSGTTDQTLARLRFTASSTEDVVIEKIALILANAASSSPSNLVGEKVSIWDGATKLGDVFFGSSYYGTSTAQFTPFTVKKGGEVKTITVKGDLTAITETDGTAGAFVAISYDGTANGTNGGYGRGADSQATITGTAATVSTNGVRVFRSVPTVAVTSTGCGSCLAQGGDLYKVKVTAGSARDIGLRAMSFEVTSTGLATVSGFQLFGPSGAVNATGVATTTGNRLRITFDNTAVDRVVQAGTSKEFTLRATTISTLTSTNVESLTVKLLSDTAYPSLAGLLGTVSAIEGSASTTDRFIWTAFSSATPEATAAINSLTDWSNSYGIPGYPSTGQDFPVQSFSH